MPLKFIEISQAGSKITKDRGFLVVKNDNGKSRFPIDNISFLIFTGYGQLISTNIMNELLTKGCMIIFCDNSFLPTSMLFPYNGHFEFQKRLNEQIGQARPLKKTIWREVVTLKVLNQGKLLKCINGDDAGLILFSKNVKSGDKENHEAQAAKRYWPKLFGENFRRSDESDSINHKLNYGYAILRGIVARNIVKVGLFPALGIFHSNAGNAYCLVDDLMEPFRPFIDKFVYLCEEASVCVSFKKGITSYLQTSFNINKCEVKFDEIVYKFVLSYYESIQSNRPAFPDFYKLSLND